MLACKVDSRYTARGAARVTKEGRKVVLKAGKPFRSGDTFSALVHRKLQDSIREACLRHSEMLRSLVAA